MYIFITGLTFKSTSFACVLPMTASLRSFSLNLISFKWVSIGSMSIKREVIRLISIMFDSLTFLSLFSLILSFIGCRCIKISRIRSELTATMNRLLNFNRISLVTFFVLCLVVEFRCIWMIGITRLIVWRLTLLTSIVDSVGRFKKVRIIVIFVEDIHAFAWLFCWNVISFVKMMVCGISLELNMPRRTMVFF